MNQHFRITALRRLRKTIVRAAPSCTLWIFDFRIQCFRFVWCPRWTITAEEIAEAA